MPSQDVAVELFYDSAWHDLVPADDVLADTPITIMRGNSDESPAPRPALVELRLENSDDMYRTGNPESPLYGKAGVNTPLRVSAGGVVRGHVEASSFAAGQSRDFRRYPRRGKAWVDVEAGGILQRVNNWSEQLKSPFRQYNEDVSGLTGYWAMEDARGSTKAFSSVPGAGNSSLLGVSFDSQQRPPGSAPLADVVLRDESFFQFVPGGTNDGWQYSVVTYMTSFGGSFFTPLNLQMQDRSNVSFSIDDSTNQVTTLSTDSSGTTRWTSTNGFDPTYFEGRWVMFVVQCTESGGTVTQDVWWRAIDENTWWNQNGTFSGTTSSLKQSSGSGLPDGSTFGHMIGTTGTVDELTDEARFTAFRGHANETTADRFARLCTLKGIAYTILGTAADSYPMGPQGVDTLAKQFEEIQTTEDGLIFDDIDAVGLVFMLRGARYNQTPALTLNAAGSSHGMPSLPVEVTDDLPVHNVVTAKQRDGGEYTATDSTSPMGTQAPPDGRNEYRQTVDVNVAEEATGLYQQAHWWLGRGTVNLPRYPQVVVNLAALDAATLAQVEAVDVGNVIEIVNYRENTIRLYALGWTETLGRSDAERVIAFTCAPDQQFVVGEWDAADSLWDSRTTTLKTAVNATATSLTFRTVSSKGVWSTTGEPYDVFVSGERITVTSMGAASLVSGAYDQTATVVRSINGIRKSLAAGDPIAVATPGRWAL